MERAPKSGDQAQQSWRDDLLAPFMGRQGRAEQPTDGHTDIGPPGVEIAAALERDQPIETSTAVTQPISDRRRVLGATAVDQVLANVYHDPKRHTVTLLLDEWHAIAIIYAIRVVAADFEAHAREVRAVAATLPQDSYGASNRHSIAIRHERIASRLRRVESRYREEVSEGGLPAD